jgi:Protein of unknown function (DUF1064)
MARTIVLDYDPTEPERPKTKWRATPTTVDGIVFASQAEATRYGELRLLLQAGAITQLVTHPRFTLAVHDEVVGVYVADFRYRTSDGLLVVEDVKSPVSRTPIYRLKRKLLRALWGIEVVEVEA